MALSPVTVAVRAVKTGMSARAGLAAARAAGIQIRDATWYRIVGEVRRGLANQITEASAPLNRRPTASEISILSTKVAKGWVQYADVFVRDKATGLVSIRPYAVRGTSLLTRQAIVNRALAAYSQAAVDDPSKYPETILGGAYTATYQMTPGTASPLSLPLPQGGAPPPVKAAPPTKAAPPPPVTPAHLTSRRSAGRDLLSSGVDFTAVLSDANQEVMGSYKFGDPMLNTIIRRQPGWGEAAHVVTPGQLDQAVSAGWTQVYKGVRRGGGKSAEEVAEAIRTGEFRVGYGIYGRGLYTTIRRTTAETYRDAQLGPVPTGPTWGPGPHHEWQGPHLGGQERGLLRMAIDPRARMITYDDLLAERKRWLDNPANMSHLAMWSAAQNDPGTYAALRGYDVIHVVPRPGINDGSVYPLGVENTSEADQYIVLNRSVIKIEEASDRYDS
ncbi:MAG TPA: hypothetical protein VFU23_03290 [Gemmatimonadales bacterium]|nr:hypothetical protein [Gemmatimonadales bacterium]